MTKEPSELSDPAELLDHDLRRAWHVPVVRLKCTTVKLENIQPTDPSHDMIGDPPYYEQFRLLRERSKLSYGELATLAGYRHRSGVQTLERPERGDKPFSLNVVRRLARHLVGRGHPPITLTEIAKLLGGSEMPFATPQQQAAVYDLLGVPLPDAVKARVSVVPSPVSLMPVVGSVQASFWMQHTPSIDTPEEFIAIPFMPDIPVAEQYALRVVGPSLNKVVLEGTYVICARYGGSHRRAQHGKIVHVERNRYGETEWTLKRLRYDRDGTGYLWPESSHPDYQDPIPLLEGDNDGAIRILGIAIGTFSKLD